MEWLKKINSIKLGTLVSCCLLCISMFFVKFIKPGNKAVHVDSSIINLLSYLLKMYKEKWMLRVFRRHILYYRYFWRLFVYTVRQISILMINLVYKPWWCLLWVQTFPESDWITYTVFSACKVPAIHNVSVPP